MYEILLNDLDICSTKETCTGCSVEGEDKVPECYQLVMARAAEAIRERLEQEKKMINQEQFLRNLVSLTRNTIANKEAYIDGLNAAMYVAMTTPTAGKEGEEHEQAEAGMGEETEKDLGAGAAGI